MADEWLGDDVTAVLRPHVAFFMPCGWDAKLLLCSRLKPYKARKLCGRESRYLGDTFMSGAWGF